MFFVAHRDGTGPGEFRVAEKQVEILGTFNAALASTAKQIDDVPLAFAYANHVHTNGPGVNAIVGATARKVRHAAARDHCFRRCAALVDAGAADVLTFNKRGAHARCGESLAERRSTLSRPNYDRVVMGSLR